MIIEINTQNPSPIYEQLRDQIVLGIAAKKLVPGEALPSVRSLAADLGINFHTVTKAYAMLCDEGYLIMDRRKGAIVTHTETQSFLPQLSHKLLRAAAEAICHDIPKDDFIALCAKCYQTASGDHLKEECC